MTITLLLQNLLSGALFGAFRGFLLCAILSACGASMCFLLSRSFGTAILLRYAPHRVQYFKDMVCHVLLMMTDD